MTPGCKQECICKGDDVFTCFDSYCDESEVCEAIDNVYDCRPTKPGKYYFSF